MKSKRKSDDQIGPPNARHCGCERVPRAWVADDGLITADELRRSIDCQLSEEEESEAPSVFIEPLFPTLQPIEPHLTHGPPSDDSPYTTEEEGELIEEEPVQSPRKFSFTISQCSGWVNLSSVVEILSKRIPQ